MEAYLDNAATTVVLEPVRKEIDSALEIEYGNPSSKHTKGLQAEKKITEARKSIAKTLKCEEKEILFTSGGTESNNMALIGTAFANQRQGKHIITTRIEHASVHEPLAFLEEQGFTVTYLSVNKNGQVEKEALLEAITEDTILLSIMYVNNEIGSVQPLEELIAAAKEKKKDILVHTDAIQAYGKYQINPRKTGIDLLSASGHKLHGPKGVGFLYIREKTKIKPVLYGGGQQKGLRSGTENVPGIAGMAAAAEYAYEKLEENRKHMYHLKETFLSLLEKDTEGVVFHAMEGMEIEDMAPHIINVGFAGVRSEVLLHALAEEGIYVSSGSACSSHHPELSGTLKAIGVKENLLDSSLRFSFSSITTEEEISYAVEKIKGILPKLRRYTRH